MPSSTAPPFVTSSPRLRREAQTVAAMVRLYCRGHHHAGPRALCPDCRELLDYARQRLGRCPFQEDKTSCADCTVHCYHPRMRQAIQEAMRYAGPRMVMRHPLLAVFHWWDKRRKAGKLKK